MLPDQPHPAESTRRSSLLAGTAIAFALTFVGVGVALLAGFVPQRSVWGEIDGAVVLLFVPLCALVLALLAEVVRIGLRPQHEVRVPVHHIAWRPGHGEG